MGLRLFAAGAALCSALGLIAAPASAARIINAVSPGVLSASGPTIGTIDGIDVSKPNTYDWTFAVAGVPVGALAQLQASIVVKHAAVVEPIELSLYGGSPGVGTLLDTSTFTAGANLFDAHLSPGIYFIELDPANIAANGELVSGAIQVSAIPEPATWSMLLFGVGMIGAGLRISRRRQAADLTAA
jgi:hypothetical protein